MSDVKARRSVQECKRRARYRAEIIERLGNRCVRCGFADVRVLQIDHVCGGGQREYVARFNRNTLAYFTHVRRELDGGSLAYQALCPTCNMLKVIERKEHLQRR